MARGRQHIPWGHRIKTEYLGPKETGFEKEARLLQLQPYEYMTSIPLRYWAMHNANEKYVPEYLLNAWGIDVEWMWDRI